MSQHVFQDKRVKVRKNHRCHGCNKDIKINESATKHSQIFDGSFYNSYFCDDCQNWHSVVCANCRECWENENCFEGYILDCKIETCVCRILEINGTKIKVDASRECFSSLEEFFLNNIIKIEEVNGNIIFEDI